jgi:hypothetical protein
VPSSLQDLVARDRDVLTDGGDARGFEASGHDANPVGGLGEGYFNRPLSL